MNTPPIREEFPPHITHLKVPPFSLQAEQSVLGAILMNNDVMGDLDALLTAEMFYRREHRLMYEAVQKLHNARKPIDLTMLMDELMDTAKLDEAGGIDYLVGLTNNVQSASNAVHYAEVVRDHYLARRLITIAHSIADSGYNSEGRSVQERIDAAQRAILEINAGAANDLEIFDLSLQRTVKEIERRHDSKGAVTGMATGFKDLDDMTLGLQKGDLIIVAGRPSMGKTAFTMNMVEYVVMHQELPVVVFSLEMPTDSLTMRLLASVGRINQTQLRRGWIKNDDWDRLSQAVAKLRNRPLYIIDTPSLGPAEIRAYLRKLQREFGGIALVAVDYLQLMQIKGKNEGRTNEMSEISRNLKLIAREFDCPLIALSQLNRDLEKRPNKRPVMSDLRESGAIEQDADVIMFVYRHEVYEPDHEVYKGQAEIIIGKQRNGPLGTVHMTYHNSTTRFWDTVRQSQQPPPNYAEPPNWELT